MAEPECASHERGGDVVHLRARLLPDGRETDLWIDGGRISHQPRPGARTVVDGGWMMPALVDAHVHVGMNEIGGPLDRPTLDSDLEKLSQAGIGAARVLGSPSPLPVDLLRGPGKPLLQTAGVPIAAPGRFFPGWGDLVAPEDLPAACAGVRDTAWVKIIVDWFDESGGYAPAFPADSLTAAVAAAHSAGQYVAVHAQCAEGARMAVEAGADSIEHGMHLPFDLLPQLAARAGVLVPTGVVFEQLAPSMTGQDVPDGLRRWFGEGHARHAELALRAWKAGVTVLAGTDLPVGALVDEIAWLAAAGLPVHDAVGAASWTARSALDLPRLREGDRADLICFPDDPRRDLDLLRRPSLIVLDGVLNAAQTF